MSRHVDLNPGALPCKPDILCKRIAEIEVVTVPPLPVFLCRGTKVETQSCNLRAGSRRCSVASRPSPAVVSSAHRVRPWLPRWEVLSWQPQGCLPALPISSLCHWGQCFVLHLPWISILWGSPSDSNCKLLPTTALHLLPALAGLSSFLPWPWLWAVCGSKCSHEGLIPTSEDSHACL